jgi:putative membrane protein
MDMSGAMIVVMAVMMVAMMGGALWGVVATRRSRSRRRSQPGRSTREILDQRYARGEITTGEYEERLRKLGDVPEGPSDPRSG